MLSLSAVILVSGICGCVGYQLGSTLDPSIKTIYVPSFINDTREPQLEVETTSAVLREFSKRMVR